MIGASRFGFACARPKPDTGGGSTGNEIVRRSVSYRFRRPIVSETYRTVFSASSDSYVGLVAKLIPTRFQTQISTIRDLQSFSDYRHQLIDFSLLGHTRIRHSA